MPEISNLITLIYLVVSVLILRQIFKKNLLLRCTNCKKLGTLRNIDTPEWSGSDLFTDDNLIDSEQVPKKNAASDDFYQCRKCGYILKLK
jgi:predicted RNA-binding Zn-ribbon protein involved in translation (DUF1610 family)